MFALLLYCPPQQEDYLIAELAECGVAGITEEPGRLRAFFDHTADAQALLQQFAPYRPELAAVPSLDWEQVARDAWPPLEIGERFYLVAPWSREETPPARLRLEIEPGWPAAPGGIQRRNCVSKRSRSSFSPAVRCSMWEPVR